MTLGDAVRHRHAALPELLLLVALLVEFLEQEEKHDGVHADPPDERLRVVAFDEEQLEGVDYDGDELHHLEGGQVLLPPEIGLHPWTHRRQKVVRVHDDVNESVEQSKEG